MKKLSIFVIGFAILLAVVVTAAWIFLEVHKPKLSGNVDLERMESRANVWYDKYGIPHIYAQNAPDAWRAFGYVHAQDRLFQMEMMRRVGAGRLADILGEEFASTDAFFRTIGTNRQAKADANKFASLPTEVQEATLAYLDGINQYIALEIKPLEFKIIGFDPEPFGVEDVYLISGYMAYSFALALRTDPVVEYLSKTLDQSYLADLDPDLVAMMADADSLSLASDGAVAQLDMPAMLDRLPVPIFQGSNSWAVDGSKSASGKPMLANDTHIKFSSPSVWYEAEITYPGYAIYGNFLAGVPFALLGHNERLAWGITMFEDDDSDFFIEQFAAPDSSATVFGASLPADQEGLPVNNAIGTAPVEKIVETIHVKDAPDSVITVYKTRNGVLINSFLPQESKAPVSMFWNYTNIDNTLLPAFYAMSTATDMAAFKEGVRNIGSPGLNVSYADSTGNIAVWSAGKLIKRPAGIDGKRFSRGYASEDAYEGYFPFEMNPHTENPSSGFIYTANEAHVSPDSSTYPGYYVPYTRSRKIEEKLSSLDQVYVGDFQNLILNAQSVTEAGVAHEVARVLRHTGAASDEARQNAIGLLADWDGDHRITDLAPTLYYKLLYHIIHDAMSDEMDEEMLDAFLGTHLFNNAYPRLIPNDDSRWWDDVKTKDVIETRETNFALAFEQSMTEIASQLGADQSGWEWGKVHTLEHQHPLGTVALLKPYFNVGPFPAPSGRETLNNAGFTLNADGLYPASYGPAMRRIIDFGDLGQAESVLPTGNSGNMMSRHYEDQAKMFVEGRFRPMLTDKNTVKKQGTKLEIE